MLTIGDQFPAYELTALIGGDLSKVDAKQPEDYFTTDHQRRPRRQVARRVLLAEGLHLRVPDRDRRVRQAERRVRRPRRAGPGRLGRQRVRALPVARPARGPQEAAVPDALGHQAGAEPGHRRSQRRRRRRPGRPSSSTPTTRSNSSRSTAGSVGRNVDEVLRVLDALQSDELCACNWRKGDPTLDAGELLKASAYIQTRSWSD